jgi:YidC/Oxa1 family membrane protein insertase
LPPELGYLWDTFLINPMVNVTIVLARLLFNNFGLAIIVFTLLIRGATLPLTLRQMHSQRKMTSLQPQINEIQKRVKDPRKRSEETMKLYKEAGASPAGCLLPMLIQFPIWIALYDVIRIVLGSTPETLIDLSGRLYGWSFIQQAVPIGNHFLLWDMGAKDPTYVMPVLVAASMFVQQKLTMTQAAMSGNSQTQTQNQTLLWMMPLMFGWFTLTVPVGLALYWVITNIVGIVMNYYVFGWKGVSLKQMLLTPGLGGLTKGSRPQTANAGRPGRSPRAQSPPVSLPAADSDDAAGADRSRAEKRGANGRNGRGGNKRKNDRRGDRSGPQSTRPGTQPGGGGST